MHLPWFRGHSTASRPAARPPTSPCVQSEVSVSATLIVNVLSAALFCATLLAVGARLRQLLRVPVGPTLRWSVDLQLGAWTVASCLLATTLAGLVAAPVLIALMAALAVAGRWKGNRRSRSPVLISAAGGLLSLAVALAPPFFFDAMVYHLGLPWQVLEEGALRPHPENIFAAFPPLAQLLSLPTLSIGMYRVPGILHWASWLAAAAGLWSMARRSGASRPQANIAAAGCMLLPVTPLVPGFPAAEGWLIAGLIPAVALVVGTRRAAARRWRAFSAAWRRLRTPGAAVDRHRLRSHRLHHTREDPPHRGRRSLVDHRRSPMVAEESDPAR